MNSGALLLKANCHMCDLRVGWGSLETKYSDVDEAMDTTLTMENEFAIFLHASLTMLWQHTFRLEYGRVTDARVGVNYGL
eukprot:4536972-Alexandrium_andersonii.AAC.1